MIGLIPDRLVLVRNANYVDCSQVQQFIIEHAEDRYLNVQARLKELADRDAEELPSEEYRFLPVKEEKKPITLRRLLRPLRAAIP